MALRWQAENTSLTLTTIRHGVSTVQDHVSKMSASSAHLHVGVLVKAIHLVQQLHEDTLHLPAAAKNVDVRLQTQAREYNAQSRHVGMRG